MDRHRVNLLTQKFNVKIVKKEFLELNKDVVVKDNIKQNAQLLEQINQRLGSAYNIIDVNMGPSIDISWNIVYFMLNIGHQIVKLYNRNLKSFLAAMCDDSKHEAMVQMQALLVKK